MIYLLSAIILGSVSIGLASIFSTMQRGLKWNASARDEPVPPLSGYAGRLDRANTNFKETFPYFLGALVAVLLQGKESNQSILGCQIYLAARILYIPLYAFAVPYIRSLVWATSVAGILIILCSAF